MEGVIMESKKIKFIDINPGEVFLGNNKGGLFFAAERPKHKVGIEYNFSITEKCISKEEWETVFDTKTEIPDFNNLNHENLELFLNKLNSKNDENKFRLPSEAEWELAKLSGKLLEIPHKNGELLADQPHISYWGAPCNGSPWLEKNEKAAGYLMQLTKTKTSSRGVSRHKLHNNKIRFRIVKLPKSHIDLIKKELPKEFERIDILKREVIIAIIIGIIPSFIWAYFNASPGYIYSGFGNLIMGGVFFSLLTGLILRPKHPTLEFSNNKLISISPYRKNIKILASFEDESP